MAKLERGLATARRYCSLLVVTDFVTVISIATGLFFGVHPWPCLQSRHSTDNLSLYNRLVNPVVSNMTLSSFLDPAPTRTGLGGCSKETYLISLLTRKMCGPGH